MDDPRKVPAAPRVLDIANPFGAPVYYRENLTSTMDAARALVLSGLPEFGEPPGPSAPHGTVIVAGYQSAGRGRAGRPWNMGRGESLPLTLILRYPALTAIPQCLTLRAGLALSLAIEDFVEIAAPPALPAGRVLVKWPNDIMLIQTDGRGKKAAGILAEAAGFSGDSGGTVYLGMGINIAQGEFPPELERKACSIAGTLCPEESGAGPFRAKLAKGRFILLEKILVRLYDELEGSGPEKAQPGTYPAAADAVKQTSWRERLLQRLYMRGKPVRFFPGAAGSGGAVKGVLAGVGDAGELLIAVDGEDRSFVTGELDVY
ncbi:MAG: biotin--[acetyl-CoA-carboxylase] ligase family protein [Treponema sp.]|jgi:BirA family biotin operon repressor/biotin-[acetyl-CoA-carboxylase] ligase|nr:biotin--[acetyl-CoA-carboxylase] ligase family protein [Treponema sp.]